MTPANQQLESILAALPLAAASLRLQRAQAAPLDPQAFLDQLALLSHQQRLERVSGLLAPSVRAYFAAPEHGLQEWFLHHALRNASVSAAYQEPADVQVVRLASAIVHQAAVALSWALARGRQSAGETPSVVWDYGVYFQAQEQLLGTVLSARIAQSETIAQNEIRAAQADPFDYLRAWLEQGSRDPALLERAGLHAAELRLLASVRVEE